MAHSFHLVFYEAIGVALSNPIYAVNKKRFLFKGLYDARNYYNKKLSEPIPKKLIRKIRLFINARWDKRRPLSWAAILFRNLLFRGCYACASAWRSLIGLLLFVSRTQWNPGNYQASSYHVNGGRTLLNRRQLEFNFFFLLR